MRTGIRWKLLCGLLWGVLTLAGAERAVDPTFLRRHVPDLPYSKSDLTTANCRYKAIFGEGDSHASIAKGVARFGQVELDPEGRCLDARYAREEQIYYVLEGEGSVNYDGERSPLTRGDFFYIPPGIRYGLAAGSSDLKLILMGYRIPAGAEIRMPAGLQKANASEVNKQVVGNHPPSTLYQLLMGDTASTRDRLSTGHVLTSLFIMEFAPGGTNFPHHHDDEEEIYLLLDGAGDMVAGGGMDGVEGRHPARPGDAYFFRLNCTVGFYNSDAPGAATAHILAARSRYPFRKR